MAHDLETQNGKTSFASFREPAWHGFLNRNDPKIKFNKAFDPIERAILTKINNKKSLYERGIMGTKNLENYYVDPVTIACFLKPDSE